MAWDPFQTPRGYFSITTTASILYLTSLRDQSMRLATSYSKRPEDPLRVTTLAQAGRSATSSRPAFSDKEYLKAKDLKGR